MGRIVTAKYDARYRDQAGWHSIAWSGRASDAAAERLRRSLNQSFQPRGSNWHVSEFLGYVPHVSRVEVLRNDRSGVVVASAAAPMFEVA